MFNSKKDTNLDNTMLTTVNDICNGAPKITSTPLNPRHQHVLRRSSVLLSPTKTKLITPRRYSLSEINSSTNKSNLRMQEAHSPGPLLASLSFKDNVSMYEETKSSGLARRLVLYNEEAEQERQPTHQEKYHSPGLFPIVHLFKKKPPLLDKSPNRVKIKLSSPDYLKSHVPQHRSKLLEGLARPKLLNQHNLSSCSQKSNETKSVLDALKEISRKRIHSNEEYDLNEDSGKRIRTELHNGTITTSKRNRADSPLLDSCESPPPKQSQKKFCVYDEFAASKSSTDFSFLNKVELGKSKRKTISTSTESLKETKHVKLINAETQTILSSTNNKIKSIESDIDEYDGEDLKKKESPLKVFDDAPLDRIRKNRLAALMGNLAGKDAAILPKPTAEDNIPSELNKREEKEEAIETPKGAETTLNPALIFTTKENINQIDSTNKPLVSILTPSKTTKELSPVRSDKHVHFILPGTTSSSTFNQTLLTQTSGSIITPIISASVNNSPVSTYVQQNSGFSLPIISAELNTKAPTTPNLISSQTLEALGSSKDHAQISTVVTSGSKSGLSFSLPASLQTSKQDTFTLPKLTFDAPKTSSSQKLGGFKFDLKTSATTGLVPTVIEKTATPTLTYSNSPGSTSAGITTSLSGANSTFTFENPTEIKKDSTFSFGAVNTVNSSVSGTTFSFGGGLPINISTATKLPSLNSLSSSGGSFGSSANPPKLRDPNLNAKFTPFGTTTTVAGSSTITTSPPSNNGSQNIDVKSTYPNFTFTQSANATTASAVFAFGSPTTVTSSSGFGSKPPSDFGTSNTPKFGNSGTAVASAFGNIPATTTTSGFGGITATSTLGFGSTAVTSFGSTSVTSTPVFGSTPDTSKSVFGTTPVTSTAIFGSTPASIPSFGTTAVTSTPVFGSTNTSVAGFGIVTPTTSSVFGVNNSTFGSNLTNTTPMFGSPNTKTPSFGSSNTTSAFGPSSAFGATNTQAPTFGSNTMPGFGNSSPPKPVFGSSTNTVSAHPSFGSNAFGSSNNNVSATSSAPIFGASNPNSTFSFGSSKPTTNVFGSVTSATSNTFGSNTFSSTSGFSSGSGFGINTPGFGSVTTSSNTFGTTSAPAFGQGENKSTFGQGENKPVFTFGGSGENKANPVFGSGAVNSAFGKSPNTQNSFGNSAGGFGPATSGFSSQANGGFNFGSSTASSSSTPFAFGSASGNADPPKPTFNFTGGSSNPPTFGSSNPSFGTPTFGATGPSTAGVFNIGAGSITGRPRTLRAKRRQ